MVLLLVSGLHGGCTVFTWWLVLHSPPSYHFLCTRRECSGRFDAFVHC